MIIQARSEIAAGEVPALIDRIRSLAVHIKHLKLLYAERALDHHRKTKTFHTGTVLGGLKRRAEMREYMHALLDGPFQHLPPQKQYGRVTAMASKKFGLSESQVRKLVKKSSLK